MSVRVAILGGDPGDVAALAELLRAAGAEPATAAGATGDAEPPASLVLLDHALLADGGAAALRRVRERHPAAQLCLFAPFAHRLRVDDTLAPLLWDALYLPAQAQDVADLVARTEAFLARRARGARQRRVLVVDDDPAIREASAAQLAGQGFAADTAADALEAIGRLHLEAYDLVITDLQMPGMDGVALLGRIRAAFPLLPVVLATGYATVETAVAALRTGASDFLRKPYTVQDFVQVVDRALRFGELARANADLESLAHAEKLRLRERQYELRVLAEAIAGLSQAVQPAQVADLWLGAAYRVVDFACGAILLAYPEPELVVFGPGPGACSGDELYERLSREAPGLTGAGGLAGVRVRRIGAESCRPGDAPAAGGSARYHRFGPASHPCAMAVTLHGAGEGLTPAQESFLGSLTAPAAQVLEKLRALAEEARQRETAMVAGMHQGVVLADPEGRILVMNRAARELLQLGAGEEMRSLARLQSGHGVPMQEAAAELLASGAETLSREFALPQPAERILTLDLTAIRGEAREPLAVVGLLRDITELRETERMKTEFVTIVSHELRTPLTTIKNCHSLLAGGGTGAVTPEQQRFLRMAQVSVDRIIRLVDDLLDVARIESGGIPLQRSTVDLAALLREVGNEVEYLLLERGQRLAYAGLDGPLPVEADRERLQQVFYNLVHNAVKFSPAGAVIELRAAAVAAADLPPALLALLPAPAERFVEVQVLDAGAGIAAGDLERIFERFQQAETTLRREHGGVGLGLPICRGIVRSHGGEIRAERREGGGSVFRVLLPRGTPAAPAPGVADGGLLR